THPCPFHHYRTGHGKVLSGPVGSRRPIARRGFVQPVHRAPGAGIINSGFCRMQRFCEGKTVREGRGGRVWFVRSRFGGDFVSNTPRKGFPRAMFFWEQSRGCTMKRFRSPEATDFERLPQPPAPAARPEAFAACPLPPGLPVECRLAQSLLYQIAFE